jgi:hypothetical protein
MKKKFFIGITGIALLFIMALGGCAPTDLSMDTTETPYAIPGPVVRADAYEGIVLLRWEPVADAVGYQIHRTDSKGVNVAIEDWDSGSYNFPKEGPFVYIDSVSAWNQLIHGESYTYTVYSLSGQSANKAALNQNSYIKNGSTSVSVTANIPDRKDPEALAWIAVDPESITVEEVKGLLLVTWDAKPNLAYEVSYNIGKGTVLGVSQDELPALSWKRGYTGYSPLNPTAYRTFPLLGGDNSVTITASFIEDNGYYTETDSQKADANFVLSDVSTPRDFEAVRDNGTVTFRWKDLETANSTYTVYKAPYDRVSNKITSDWVQVTLTAPAAKQDTETIYEYDVRVDENAYVEYRNWIASEVPVALDASYFYTVVATAGAAKSGASNVDTVDKAELDSRPVTVELREGTAERDVQITWERLPHDATVTYELSRAEFNVGGNGIWTGNSSDIVSFGPWTTITVNSARYTETKGVVVDTPPDINAYYAYKLVVKQDTRSSEAEYGFMAEEGAYIKANYYTLTEDFDTHNPHGFVALKVSTTLNYTHGSASVKLYRRVYEAGNPQEPYVLVSPDPFAAVTNEQYWIDRNANSIGTEYQYRIVVLYTDGTSRFVDLNNDDVEIEADPKVAEINNVSLDVTGTTVKFNFSGSYLAEAPISIFFDGELNGTYDVEKTDAGSKIIQVPKLLDTAGPPAIDEQPVYNFTTFTGLPFDTTYEYKVQYKEGDEDVPGIIGGESEFTTAALRLREAENTTQPHGSVRLQLTSGTSSSGRGIDWSGYSGTTITVTRRTVDTSAGWPRYTYGPWAAITSTVPFSPQTFFNGVDEFGDPVTSQFLIDIGTIAGTQYQYRVVVSGTGEFADSPSYMIPVTDPAEWPFNDPISPAVVWHWGGPSWTVSSNSIRLTFSGNNLENAPIRGGFNEGLAYNTADATWEQIPGSIRKDNTDPENPVYFINISSLDPGTWYTYQIENYQGTIWSNTVSTSAAP